VVTLFFVGLSALRYRIKFDRAQAQLAATPPAQVLNPRPDFTNLLSTGYALNKRLANGEGTSAEVDAWISETQSALTDWSPAAAVEFCPPRRVWKETPESRAIAATVRSAAKWSPKEDPVVGRLNDHIKRLAEIASQ